jgi:hypothetical protein
LEAFIVDDFVSLHFKQVFDEFHGSLVPGAKNPECVYHIGTKFYITLHLKNLNLLKMALQCSLTLIKTSKASN